MAVWIDGGERLLGRFACTHGWGGLKVMCCGNRMAGADHSLGEKEVLWSSGDLQSGYSSVMPHIEVRRGKKMT